MLWFVTIWFKSDEEFERKVVGHDSFSHQFQYKWVRDEKLDVSNLLNFK